MQVFVFPCHALVDTVRQLRTNNMISLELEFGHLHLPCNRAITRVSSVSCKAAKPRWFNANPFSCFVTNIVSVTEFAAFTPAPEKRTPVG